jgi:uncharacterized protein YaiI (UPF0178 family)
MSKLFAKRSSKPHDPKLCKNLAAAAAAQRGEDYFDENVSEAEKADYFAAKIKAQKEQATTPQLAAI